MIGECQQAILFSLDLERRNEDRKYIEVADLTRCLADRLKMPKDPQACSLIFKPQHRDDRFRPADQVAKAVNCLCIGVL